MKHEAQWWTCVCVFNSSQFSLSLFSLNSLQMKLHSNHNTKVKAVWRVPLVCFTLARLFTPFNFTAGAKKQVNEHTLAQVDTWIFVYSFFPPKATTDTGGPGESFVVLGAKCLPSQMIICVCVSLLPLVTLVCLLFLLFSHPLIQFVVIEWRERVKILKGREKCNTLNNKFTQCLFTWTHTHTHTHWQVELNWMTLFLVSI